MTDGTISSIFVPEFATFASAVTSVSGKMATGFTIVEDDIVSEL